MEPSRPVVRSSNPVVFNVRTQASAGPGVATPNTLIPFTATVEAQTRSATPGWLPASRGIEFHAMLTRNNAVVINIEQSARMSSEGGSVTLTLNDRKITVPASMHPDAPGLAHELARVINETTGGEFTAHVSSERPGDNASAASLEIQSRKASALTSATPVVTDTFTSR